MNTHQPKQPFKIQAGRFYMINGEIHASPAEKDFKFQEGWEPGYKTVPLTSMETDGEYWNVAENGYVLNAGIFVEYECDKDGNPIEQKDEQPPSQPTVKQTALPPSREQVWLDSLRHAERLNADAAIAGKSIVASTEQLLHTADRFLAEYDKRFNKQEGK